MSLYLNLPYDGEFDTAVLGGFPVTIRYKYQGADTTVGIWPHCDWWVHAINGRVCKKQPEWLYKRLDAAGYNEAIQESCGDDYRNS
jgi:hypothetical protein